MLGIIGKIKWFIVGLVIGSLVTYIFIGEQLSGVREKIKQWLSLEMGAAYTEEVNIAQINRQVTQIAERSETYLGV